MPRPPNAETQAPRTYYPELDGVRALATVMVMVFHLAQQGIPIPVPVILGQTGVDLFFVLSGFLITTILLRSPQGDWHEVRTFYVRRVLRIFPLYYGFLILSLFVSRCSLPFWVYLQNIWIACKWHIAGPNHFWSLAVEEQFYLVWPFVVLFLPRRWLNTSLWAMILGALGCRLILVHTGISPFYFTLSRLDGLAAGALLAVLNSREALAPLKPVLVSVFGIALLATGVEGVLAKHGGGPWIQVTKFSIVTALYTIFLGILLTNSRRRWAAPLRSNPLRLVGRISYGLYVLHPVVFAFVFARESQQPAPIRAFLAVLLTFLLALLSWFGFERHFLAFKDRLAPERVRFSSAARSLEVSH